MKTANFDLVAEINEELINRALGALFYKGFLDIRGEYIVPVEEIPPALDEFRKISYKLKLKDGPTLDFLGRDTVKLLVSAEAVFTVLNGIRLEFDVVLSIKASLVFDPETAKLSIDFSKAEISDVDINDRYDLPSSVLNKFNEIISIAVREDLLDRSVDITPSLFLLEMPEMPPGAENKLPVKFKGMKILNDEVVAICINFLDYDSGRLGDVTDFTESKSLALALGEDGMKRVFDFWWERTTNPKSVSGSGRYDIPYVDDFLDFIADTVDLATKIASLGFVETDFEVEDAWVDHSATIKFDKPSFDIKPNERLEISLSAKLDLAVTAKTKISVTTEVDTSGPIPDWMTPWEDDIQVGRTTTNVTLFSLSISDLDISVDRAAGRVYLDDENRIMGDLEEIRVSVNLGDEWYTYLPEYILNKIIDFVEDLVKEKIPPIVLSPALISQEVPMLGEVEVDVDVLETFEKEAVVSMMVSLKDIERFTIPVPRYVANSNPASLEVHRAECRWVQEINEENKVGYFILYDAFKDGYDGCRYCLPEYHTR